MLLEDINKIINVQNESLLVGSFYKNPDLFIEHGRYIKSKYDFADEVTKFFYENYEVMYKTFTQTIDETKIFTFMSQDSDKLKIYKKYGGYKTIKTWMELANEDDFKNYLETVKKYSLLREYNNKGYAVDKIMAHPKFDLLKANDIYKLIRATADKVSTVILANEESVVVNKEATKVMKGYLIKPDMGLEMPFEILNDCFKGMRLGKFYCNGMMSNEGKTRLSTLIGAYIAFVKGEKVLFMCNETSEEDFKACLIVSAINNKWFRELHNIKLPKNEKEFTLGVYRDNKGEVISRKCDENGEYIETEEEYIERVYEESDEFKEIYKVCEWIESQIDNKIFFKYMDDYSDDMIEFEIRKHNTVHGVKYFFYDTMKCYKEENWALLKGTAEVLQKLCLQLKMFGWGNIQLTDDTVVTDIFQLSSQNIASARHLKHVLDHLTFTVRINKEEYHKYQYIPNEPWGDREPLDLSLSKNYSLLHIEKNRGGAKDRKPLLEVDLNYNTWYEVGELIKKSK